MHVPHGGLWEFPGGKLEDNESLESALVREIKEEVGIEVHQYQYIGTIDYQYPDKSVQLIIYYVYEFSGIPDCLEGQMNMKWINRNDLHDYDFPEANKHIIDLLPIFE